MAAMTSEELVTKTMYDAARAGLEGCLRFRERAAVVQGIDWPVPDHVNYIDEWQPKLSALIEYYNLRKAMKNGPQLTD